MALVVVILGVSLLASVWAGARLAAENGRLRRQVVYCRTRLNMLADPTALGRLLERAGWANFPEDE